MLLGAHCRTAARDAEIIIKHVAMKAAHTRWQMAKCKAHIQHLIIE